MSLDIQNVNENDLVFTSLNKKYLPEIITTKYSSAHIYTPHMFYYVECLDEAYDLKARISLQVREWDRHFTNGVDMDKGIPSSRMDDRSFDIFGLGYDDYEDHDDEKLVSLISGKRIASLINTKDACFEFRQK